MLKIRPISLKDAAAFVRELHRHNKPPQGGKFAVACYEGDRLCGVAIVGRPVARRLDDGLTAEITRCCTDGTRNACSKLYSAAKRTAQAMGYAKVITYTLTSETGSSLYAIGAKVEDANCGGGEWSKPSRPREKAEHNTGKKVRWDLT